jgi:replicative DNA helicase
MTKGEITIIGGRPSHGKTTLVINMIKACVDQGLKVMVFNREMTNVEMIKKLLVLESEKLSYLKIRRGMIGDLNDSAEINNTMDRIKSKYNKDKFQMFDNIQTLEKASVEVQKFQPDIIFDDFIQLIKPKNASKDRRFQIEEIVHTYKWLAKSTNSVAVLVSQLNRGVEYRTGADAKPKMSDLAESGSIEQSAENVIFVYYPFKVSLDENKDSKNKLQLIGSKVRYGVSGTSDVGFDGDKVKIYQSEDHYRKSGYGS